MSILKLSVQVERTQLDKLQQDIDKLKTGTISVKVDTSGFSKMGQAVDKTTQSSMQLVDAQGRILTSTKKTSEGIKEVGNAAEGAGKKVNSFVGTFVKSAVIYQTIYAVRQAFLDAFDTIKQVETELVNVRKVTKMSTAEMAQLKDTAYEKAAHYGIGVTDYLSSVVEFARAGYKDASEALAEVSTKTQIAGNVTAEVANQFLLSMDAAYKYGGSVENLTRVLDGANEIGNNYATSVQKIAEGLGLIAPLAAQAHISEEELTAALGTITAVTQRSGSEAARALRALVLNIIGDTTTEIEDGVTATEESVKSLQGLLREYAPDAVAAAEATGEIINPMEAIAALSKAMEDGLLTEQELMQRLTALGGKLRTSQLVALVSNYDMYKDMISTYKDAAGSADREIGYALDTWERKAAKLANTWASFIEKSVSTNSFKGLIDGLTTVLNLFGNLGNMLFTIGGAFVALKLPAIINNFNAWRSSIQSASESLTVMGISCSTLQIAIAAVTAAITIGIMAYNAYRQAIEEDIDAANQRASKAVEEAEDVYALYQTYAQAKSAYETGAGSKDAYKKATIELAEALGIEESQIAQNITQLESLTAAEIEAAKLASEVAIKKRMDDWHPTDTYSKYGGTSEAYSATDRIFDTSERNIANQKNYLDRAKAIVKTYDEAVKVQGKFADLTKDGTQLSREQSAEWEAAQLSIEKYGGYVDELRNNLENISTIEGLDLSDWGEASDDAEQLNDNLSETEKQFSSLAEAASEATKAIEDYKNATKVEKDDNFKSYAGIYEDFLTDWEAGLTGSNKVRAAIEALLPEDMINDLWKQGKDAGEVLASEFYQGIFTYIDDNGERQFTKGEDRGSLLAYALWDDDTLSQYVSDTEKVIKLGNDVVASLTMDGDQLSVSVKDFDALAEAMYEISGVSLSGDTLAAWMESLGMYSPSLQYTADEMKDIAEQAKALNEEGEINLQDFVKGQLDLGKPKEEVRDMVDKLIELNGISDSGIKLDVDDSEVEAARKECADLIAAAETPIDMSVDSEEAKQEMAALEAKAVMLGMMRAMIGVGVADNATSALDGIESKANQLDGKVVNISVNAITSAAQNAIANVTSSFGRSAVGTSSAAGGVTLVNEQGPEVIQEGATARIAGGGQPTITWVEPGATIYNALDTRRILGGIDPSLLYGGINAFAGGTASGITRWRSTTTTAAKTAAGTSVGASAAKGTSTSAIKTSTLKTEATKSTSEDERLKQLKDIVSLRQSELSLLEAQEASVKSRIDKQRQIQSALMDQINYLKAIGGSQEEINKLYEEWYKIEKSIADLQDSLYSELKTSIQKQIEKLNEARDAEKKKIQEQLDLMEEQRNTRNEQLELEEKILAVQEAEAALQNAMTERTVRYFNAVTGQWEWSANASNVKTAAERLESAQKALEEYQDNKAYEAARAELEAQQDAIDAKYDDLENRWQRVIDSLEAPVKSVAESLTLLAKNYVPSMSADVKKLNSLLSEFGYSVNTNNGTMTYRATSLPVYDSGGVLEGVGGIKATALSEMVLPPDITSKMLSVTSGNAVAARLDELRYLYGVGGSKSGTATNNIESQHNGDIYKFGNISLTERQANSMTVAELARASRSLRLYNANM